MVQTWRALHGSLLKIALRHRCFYIENFILMAASEDNFILEIFLNGYFSKTTAKIYLS